MPDSTPFPLTPPPGVVLRGSDAVIEGRWKATQWVRFYDGKPEKRGGFLRLSDTLPEGYLRSLHAWRDLGFLRYIAAGTYKKLYVYEYNDFSQHDITPLAESGTLGSDPFTTTNGSNVVSVSDAAHGRRSGDTVSFSGASTFNNVTINGTYTVLTVTNANTYTITAGTTANATGSGGGSSVLFEYEIGIGAEAGTFGVGYGVGRYGIGTYGTAREGSTLSIEPRVWSFDNFGENLLAAYNGGTIFEWDPDGLGAGTKASAIANAPDAVLSIFVTEERFVFALREDMVVSWCSQNDYNDWTPTETNTANSRRLQIGSRLIAGRALGNRISLIWTDTTVYAFQYTGSASVFSSRSLGKNCGLIAPNCAVVDARGAAYWMGANGFYVFNGAVQEIPNVNDIKSHVFDNIRRELAFLCFAHYDAKFEEINWYYVVEGQTVPTKYVTYHIKDQCWSSGDMSRVGACNFYYGETRPIYSAPDGYLYLHEYGYNDADGNAIEASIELAPYALRDGKDILDVDGFVADFPEQSGNLSIAFEGFDRLRQSAIDSQTITVAESQDLKDLRICARHIGLSLTSNEADGYFRWGKPMALIKSNGMRR